MKVLETMTPDQLTKEYYRLNRQFVAIQNKQTEFAKNKDEVGHDKCIELLDAKQKEMSNVSDYFG